MEKRIDVVSGVWKFNLSVGEEKLIKFCNESLSQNPRYTSILIRQTGRNNLGIFFTYHSNMRPEVVEKLVIDEQVPKIRAVFGNDFTGWDVCSPTIIIK